MGNYILFQRMETALLGEKANKLFGICRILDLHLRGTYQDILEKKGVSPQTSWGKKLWVLNETLAPITDLIAESFPGVGVGYYSKELDAILAYGPSKLFGDKIGLPVDEDHVGRRCMRNRREIVAVGSMVRGEIMNCVIPIIRSEEVIGFIWANEALEDIYNQIAPGGINIFFSPKVEPLLGLTGMLMLTGNMLLEVSEIKEGKELLGIAEYIERTSTNLKRYLELFLNNLDLLVIISDNNGIVRFCSKQLEAWELDKSGNFEGRPLHEVLARLGFTNNMNLSSRFTERQELSHFETVNFSFKGREINLTMSPLWGREEDPIGTITIVEDLTAAHSAEERLRRMESIIVAEQLAVALAHEFRNPLTVLRGAVKIIPERLHDEEYLKKFVEVALSEIDRMDRIARSLLELTRYAKPEFMAINIHEVLNRAVELVRTMARDQKVTIVEVYQAPSPFIYGDPEHLQQAFLNLFLNALQAMPEGGCLTIKTSGERHGKVIYIKISDTGPGIPKELQDKVFNLFFTTKRQGTGLGLPLTQSIIYRHQGLMLLESEPGSGTTFTIVLPRKLIYRENKQQKLR
ncbi:MAG: ATP-binding protein [Moorellaceae bacterium]